MKADHSGKPPLRDDPTTKRGGGESFGKGGRGVETLIFFRNISGVPDMKKGVSLVGFPRRESSPFSPEKRGVRYNFNRETRENRVSVYCLVRTVPVVRG